jgi:hypothetical protein
MRLQRRDAVIRDTAAVTKIKQQPALFVVFVTSVLLVVDLFLPWQEIDGKQTSGFTGVGIAAMIFVAFIVVESTLQARGVVKKIPVPPAILILLPSLLALILVVVKFFVDSEGRQSAAWVGLALAVALHAAAVVNALPTIKMGIRMRRMMKEAKSGAVPAAKPAAKKQPAAKKKAAAKPGAATSQGASCDGDWAITMETPMGRREMTLTLSSQGSELSGRADTPFGVQEFDGGVVNGDDISWEIDVTTPMPMTLTFKATVAGDRLNGTAEVAGMGESPFEGVRQS